MDKITFKDSGKLIRLADSLETNAVVGWLSASGTVSKSIITAEKAFQNVRKHYKSILTDYPTFRIKLITNKDNNLPYWYYATDDDIQFENLVKLIENDKLIDEVPPSYEPDIVPLWRLHISQIGDKTKIKFMASHAITDGRSVFDLMELMASYALDKRLNDKLESYKNQPVLYEYGKKEWFTKEITDINCSEPYIDIDFRDAKLNPPVDLPSHVINPQWDVDYIPISKFCRKHSITPQSILMAIQNEAIRIFNEGKYDDIPITIYIPVDCRPSPYATEIFKKSLFYSHAGIILPFVNKEDDILQNIKQCYKVLKEYVATTKASYNIYHTANFRNRETGEFKFPKIFPNPINYVCASHLGLVGVGFNDVQFKSYSPVCSHDNEYYDSMYWPNLYGYHNEKTFSFMMNYPYNLPENYFKSIKDTSLKFYDFIVNDIKN